MENHCKYRQEEVKTVKQNVEKYNILKNVIKSIVRKYNKI